MSKSKRYEGQLPLMNTVDNKSIVEEAEVIPMEFNSKVELGHFEQAMLDVVPEERRGDPQVKQSIDSIYTAYYNVVNATKALAIAVFHFCELTGCEYSAVGTAWSKGIQRQLSKGYISKLYHAGKALSVSPVAKRITDIDKLATVGRLDVNEIKSSLSETGGQAMLGGKYVSLMSRDQFRETLSEMHPSRFDAPKPKTFNARTARETIQGWIDLNSTDTELVNSFKNDLRILDARIKAIDDAKLAERQAKKLERAQAKVKELQATA